MRVGQSKVARAYVSNINGLSVASVWTYGIAIPATGEPVGESVTPSGTKYTSSMYTAPT